MKKNDNLTALDDLFKEQYGDKGTTRVATLRKIIKVGLRGHLELSIRL